MLNNTHIIKGRWKIVSKIGQGAFGEIYQARNVINNELVAIKAEKVDSKKQVLKLEVAVLKKLQECPYVCRFITCGRFGDCNYLVMELLGENLSEIRRKQPDQKFSMSCTLKLGIQMLRAIESVHELGYLHRDIKPSNFAIGLSSNKRNTVFMIDYGLARRYVLPTGEVRVIDSAGFRGTARYASIQSHLSQDLGRRDDLWSLFYVLVEFAKGLLPWRKIKDKDQIGEMKIQYNNGELVKGLPNEFLLFMQHLQSLQFGDKPDYKLLNQLLKDLLFNYDSFDVPLDVEFKLAQDKKKDTIPGIELSPNISSSRFIDDSRDDVKAQMELTRDTSVARTNSGFRSATDISAIYQTASFGRNTLSKSTIKTISDVSSLNGLAQIPIANPIIVEDETYEKKIVVLPASGDSLEDPPQNLKDSKEKKKSGSQKGRNKLKESRENEEHQAKLLSLEKNSNGITKSDEMSPGEVNVEIPSSDKRKRTRSKPKLVSTSFKPHDKTVSSEKKKQNCKSCTII